MSLMNLIRNIYLEETNDGSGTGGGAGGGDITPELPQVSDLNDEQLTTLELSDDQKQLLADGKELELSDEQKEKLTQMTVSKSGEGSGDGITYSDFTMPDGIELDKQLLDAVSPVFKELELSQENAQKLIDAYIGVVQEKANAFQQEYESTVEGWQQAVLKDKTLGGDNLNETKRLSTVGLEKFGTPELKQFLTEHGVIHHPEMVKLLVTLGQISSEDIPGLGNAPGGGAKSLTQQLYPSSYNEDGSPKH